MLTDSQIRKIALVVAVIGLIGMIILAYASEPEKIKIGDITDEKLGKIAEVSGQISACSEKDGNVFITLADGGKTVPVIIFERDARNQELSYNLTKGDNITVTGKIALYKNEIEIQAFSIRKA